MADIASKKRTKINKEKKENLPGKWQGAAQTPFPPLVDCCPRNPPLSWAAPRGSATKSWSAHDHDNENYDQHNHHDNDHSLDSDGHLYVVNIVERLHVGLQQNHDQHNHLDDDDDDGNNDHEMQQ